MTTFNDKRSCASLRYHAGHQVKPKNWVLYQTQANALSSRLAWVPQSANMYSPCPWAPSQFQNFAAMKPKINPTLFYFVQKVRDIYFRHPICLPQSNRKQVWFISQQNYFLLVDHLFSKIVIDYCMQFFNVTIQVLGH